MNNNKIEPWVKIEKRLILNSYSRIKLTTTEKLFIIGITALANDSINFPTDEEGYTSIASKVLANELGMSERTVFNCLNSIADKGVLLIKTRYISNKKKTPLELKVVFPDMQNLHISDVQNLHNSDMQNLHSNKDNKLKKEKENRTKESININSTNNISYMDQKEIEQITTFFNDNGMIKDKYYSFSDWSNYHNNEIMRFKDRTNIDDGKLIIVFMDYFKRMKN